jgi:hypothetical protein
MVVEGEDLNSTTAHKGRIYKGKHAAASQTSIEQSLGSIAITALMRQDLEYDIIIDTTA